MIIIERREIITYPIIESTTCVVFCVFEITTGKPTEMVQRHCVKSPIDPKKLANINVRFK